MSEDRREHLDRREFNAALIEASVHNDKNSNNRLLEIIAIIMGGVGTASILWAGSTLIDVLTITTALKDDLVRMESVHKDHIKEYKKLRKFTRQIAVLNKEIDLLDKRIDASNNAHREMISEIVSYYRENPKKEIK